MPHIDMPGQHLPMTGRLIGWTLLLFIGSGLAWRFWQIVS